MFVQTDHLPATNWGRVGWGGVWYHSSVLQDMMRCYATHGVGWGGVWYHSSVLQDMMRCYATHGVGWGVILFVSTARHDVMLRYAWGGVGWGVISFVNTARHDAMLRYAWGGVGWVVISFVSTARHDAMLRYAWGGVGCDIIRQYCKTWCGVDGDWKLMKKSIPDSIRSQVQGKRNGLLFKYIRSQQWRWAHTGFDLLTATGEAVRSLMRWREKATLFVRRVLQHKTL